MVLENCLTIQKKVKISSSYNNPSKFQLNVKDETIKQPEV